MSNITDEQVYQEYFRRLDEEYQKSIQVINFVSDGVSGKISTLFTIKHNCPENYEFFSDKYRLTACAQLRHNEKLFIKSSIETYELCKKFDDYIKSKLT